MKKMSLALALVLAIASAKPAMAAGGSDMALGLAAGANISNASLSTGSSNSRTGFYFGGLFDYKLADMFYLNPGLIYTMKGFEQSTTLLGVTTVVDYKLSYLDIPLNLKVKFMDGESVIPYLYAGPYVGIKMSSSADVTVGGIAVTGATITGVKSTEFGVNLGGGAEFGIGDGMSLLANLQYQLGLSNAISSTATAKNRGLMIGLGLMFAM